jgi:hypothetical protein
VTRVFVVFVALLIGAAAPARAWCEATCLAPAHDAAKPHCPAHDSTTGSALSASDNGDCPVVESARPIPAKVDLQASAIETFKHLSTPAPSHLRTIAPSHFRTLASRRLTPLRI